MTAFGLGSFALQPHTHAAQLDSALMGMSMYGHIDNVRQRYVTTDLEYADVEVYKLQS